MDTYQPEHNEEDLDDVGVGHGDETSEKGVAQGDDGGHDDGDLLVDVEDDLERGAEGTEDGGRPEDLGDCGRKCLGLVNSIVRMTYSEDLVLTWRAPHLPYF